MTRLIAVEGPLAYLDVPTVDGRLLLRESMLPMMEKLPFVMAGDARDTVLGLLDRVELWGNIVWGYGAAQVSGERLHISLGVAGQSRMIDDTLTFTNWWPHSIAVHGSDFSPWESSTYLEASRQEVYT